MADPMQQAREVSSPEAIAFRLRNLAKNMAAGSDPAARDHQAWKRVEELAEAVAALRAAPEGFVLVPVEPTREMLLAEDSAIPDDDSQRDDPFAWGRAGWAAMLAARPQGVNHG